MSSNVRSPIVVEVEVDAVELVLDVGEVGLVEEAGTVDDQGAVVVGEAVVDDDTASGSVTAGPVNVAAGSSAAVTIWTAAGGTVP